MLVSRGQPRKRLITVDPGERRIHSAASMRMLAHVVGRCAGTRVNRRWRLASSTSCRARLHLQAFVRRCVPDRTMILVMHITRRRSLAGRLTDGENCACTPRQLAPHLIDPRCRGPHLLSELFVPSINAVIASLTCFSTRTTISASATDIFSLIELLGDIAG